MEHLSLLAGGQEHSRADWEKATADVLRKTGRMTPEDPDALVVTKLTKTTLDGIEVPPLGTADSIEGVPATGLPGQAPYTRGAVTRRQGPEEADGWDIRAHLGDPDPEQAAADAITDLEHGVTSLWLTVGRGGIAVSDLPRVLRDVFLDLAPVVIDSTDEPLSTAEAFCAILEERAITPARGTVLSGDLIARNGGFSTPLHATAVARLAELARKHGTFALTVDGSRVHDAGASDAQELGYSLAAGAEYLRLLTEDDRLSVADAAALLEFRYAATVEQFPTIAKFRAARRLWHRVLVLSGAPEAAGQVQHAVTSRPMMTKYDPWVNMLRGTVAAFAAGVGGATSVTVLPFDTAIGLPDALARRNARNTSSLLIHESHLGKVEDLGGGSYAIEKLTDDLAAAGWAEFQKIEAEGGIAASVSMDNGGLLDRIHVEVAKERRRQVGLRKRPVTGVSEFPNLHEQLPDRRPFPEFAPHADRHSHAFELLRDEPATTPVFLATLGPIAAHTARATFASNLLAAGGIDTVVAGATASPDGLLATYTGQSVVCLAGTDKTYAEWGAEAITALRGAGAKYVIIAGKPIEGVDDSCAIGVDALAFLDRVREELSR